MLWTIAVLLVVASQVHGHSYKPGSCPKAKPMENFDINKFLGKWYVIQQTLTGNSCLVNTYTEDVHKKGHYKIDQVSEHYLLGITNHDRKFHYTGTLTVPKHGNASEMRAHFRLNFFGSASYIVVTTDYTNYAGVFTCQKLPFSHRKSATILSRTKTLDQATLDKVRGELANSGTDLTKLNVIRQDNCTQSSGHNTTVKVDQITIAPKSFDEVFRTAGEKIGEGFETLADTAKGIFNTFRGDHGESKEDLFEKRDMKEDAEWLP